MTYPCSSRRFRRILQISTSTTSTTRTKLGTRHRTYNVTIQCHCRAVYTRIVIVVSLPPRIEKMHVNIIIVNNAIMSFTVDNHRQYKTNRREIKTRARECQDCNISSLELCPLVGVVLAHGMYRVFCFIMAMTRLSIGVRIGPGINASECETSRRAPTSTVRRAR